ncbi:MAG: hypothetical protein R2863_12210 [Candidatus Kapaibacterium sp.]
MPILQYMKSAFFIIFLLFPVSIIPNTITIANQSGKLKTVNIINSMGYEYSDFEYTTSCIIGDFSKDSSGINFDGKSLQLRPNSNIVKYIVAGQIVQHTMGMPVLNISNRICVPIKDYFYSLDSLGICKIITNNDNYFKIQDYKIFKRVPNIENYKNKYNLAYFEQVYNEVNKAELNKKKARKKVKIVKTDKTLDLIKEALKEEKSEVPSQPVKKDDYYDIPRGLNRDGALKKKKD